MCYQLQIIVTSTLFNWNLNAEHCVVQKKRDMYLDSKISSLIAEAGSAIFVHDYLFWVAGKTERARRLVQTHYVFHSRCGLSFIWSTSAKVHFLLKVSVLDILRSVWTPYGKTRHGRRRINYLNYIYKLAGSVNYRNSQNCLRPDRTGINLWVECADSQQPGVVAVVVEEESLRALRGKELTFVRCADRCRVALWATASVVSAPETTEAATTAVTSVNFAVLRALSRALFRFFPVAACLRRVRGRVALRIHTAWGHIVHSRPRSDTGISRKQATASWCITVWYCLSECHNFHLLYFVIIICIYATILKELT